MAAFGDPRKMYPAPGAQEKDDKAGMQPAPGAESEMAFKPDHGEASYVGTGRLAGRAVLVTGADSGIGRAVAVAMAREGADVALAWSGSPAEEADAGATADLVARAGRKHVLLPADLATDEACVALVERARGAGLGDGPAGGLDVLVLNHAVQPAAAAVGEAVQAVSRAGWDAIQAVNVGACWSLIRAALPHMRAERGPSIIVSTSVEAYAPEAAILPYAVSKAALRALVQGLAPELVATKGVRINGVAPGEDGERERERARERGRGSEGKSARAPLGAHDRARAAPPPEASLGGKKPHPPRRRRGRARPWAPAAAFFFFVGVQCGCFPSPG